MVTLYLNGIRLDLNERFILGYATDIGTFKRVKPTSWHTPCAQRSENGHMNPYTGYFYIWCCYTRCVILVGSVQRYRCTRAFACIIDMFTTCTSYYRCSNSFRLNRFFVLMWMTHCIFERWHDAITVCNRFQLVWKKITFMACFSRQIETWILTVIEAKTVDTTF